MQIAALYDIHGNLPALEAVLQELQTLSIDQVVVGGDVILGPMSNACLDLLLNLKIPVHFILGNCEVAVLAQMENRPIGQLPASVLEDIQWTAEQMLPVHQQVMMTWGKTHTIELPGLGKVMFCHATPRNENENFTQLSSRERLHGIFQSVDADLVICGHTHMQFDMKVGKLRVINAGSIGMPFGKPGAYWLLLGEKTELRFTPYPLERAAARILETDYPQAAHFAQNHILQAPNEKQMLALLS